MRNRQRLLFGLSALYVVGELIWIVHSFVEDKKEERRWWNKDS